jgi:glyoxylase-like metal-dependent hydrolase (beta-lactamase superfamily II)
MAIPDRMEENMRIKRLTQDVYACLQHDTIGWGYNNTGLIARGGGLVVDTMWDLALTRRMIELFSSVCRPPYRYLVNTHANGDHCWGNQLFPETRIIAHSSCKHFLETKSDPGYYHRMLQSSDPNPGLGLLQTLLKKFDFSNITIVPPEISIESRLELDLDGLKCRIIHVGPSHTSGDLIVHLPEHGVVFAGDIIFSHCTPVGWDGTLQQWIKALATIRDLKPKYIVPGHGPLCTTEEIEQNMAYLTYVFDRAHDCYQNGLNELEAVRKIKPTLPEPYAGWPEKERLVINVFYAYREFSGNPAPIPDLFTMFEYIQQVGFLGQNSDAPRWDPGSIV